MGEMSEQVIEGVGKISSYIQRSEPTLMKMIKDYDLEKRAIVYRRGGRWVANREKLRAFWLGLLIGNPGKLRDENQKKTKETKRKH